MTLLTIMIFAIWPCSLIGAITAQIFLNGTQKLVAAAVVAGLAGLSFYLLGQCGHQAFYSVACEGAPFLIIMIPIPLGVSCAILTVLAVLDITFFRRSA